ncbi:MAG: hypothetical protein FWD49_03545 [Firmicutes bacterium]|nr:hypothetical protein [Bacillota bacterium]
MQNEKIYNKLIEKAKEESKEKAKEAVKEEVKFFTQLGEKNKDGEYLEYARFLANEAERQTFTKLSESAVAYLEYAMLLANEEQKEYITENIIQMYYCELKENTDDFNKPFENAEHCISQLRKFATGEKLLSLEKDFARYEETLRKHYENEEAEERERSAKAVADARTREAYLKREHIRGNLKNMLFWGSLFVPIALGLAGLIGGMVVHFQNKETPEGIFTIFRYLFATGYSIHYSPNSYSLHVLFNTFFYVGLGMSIAWFPISSLIDKIKP